MSLRIDANNLPDALTRTAQPQTTATDFKQFAALRRGAEANDPKVLREAARQFESLFTKMMLDSMRSASFGDPLFGSDQADMYQDMMDDQLSIEMSKGKGLGLADMLIRQLSHAAPGAASAAEAGQPRPLTDAARQKFVDELLPHAEAAARELGVDARAIVAQAALETGWGSSMPADESGTSHNLFGIKAAPNARAGSTWNGAHVTSDTTEFTAGIAQGESAQFRAYGSPAESVRDYVKLLRDNPRYAAALDTGTDVRAFAAGLQRGGYATDPEYANKLVSVAEQVSERLARPEIAAGFKADHTPPIDTKTS
jgi:flagellar protein FlgJ